MKRVCPNQSQWQRTYPYRFKNYLPSLPSQFSKKNLQVHRILLKFVSDFFQTKA